MRDANPRGSAKNMRDLTDLRSVLTSEGFASQDEAFETAADRALIQRPLFTIRAQLILAFSLFFLLCLGITLWSIAMLSDVQERILFLEVADQINLHGDDVRLIQMRSGGELVGSSDDEVSFRFLDFRSGPSGGGEAIGQLDDGVLPRRLQLEAPSDGL